MRDKMLAPTRSGLKRIDMEDHVNHIYQRIYGDMHRRAALHICNYVRETSLQIRDQLRIVQPISYNTIHGRRRTRIGALARLRKMIHDLIQI